MERSGQEFMDFAKQAFQATLDAASKVQQQTHKLMEELIRQGTMAQGEGKRLSSLAPATKQEVQELRQRVDDLAKKIDALERR